MTSLPLEYRIGIVVNMMFPKTAQTSNQALVAPGKAGQSNSKAQDLKPRLLLMGLRRYNTVFPSIHEAAY